MRQIQETMRRKSGEEGGGGFWCEGKEGSFGEE